MYTAWTKHIKEEKAKEDFINEVKSSRKVLWRLQQLLDEEENAVDRSELDIKTFDLPNWENRQAYKNGYRASLRMLKKLIDLDQQHQR